MKNDSYLEKEVIKIPQFEVGGEYKDDNGNEYKVLSIQGDLMEAKFNFVKKKFRIKQIGLDFLQTRKSGKQTWRPSMRFCAIGTRISETRFLTCLS